ncbi:hypothetical protein LSAT2_026724 [Lamellibrachia satsuma]|nr:hypothetical protein LSAT2_026724 [Lamellibrachia satsuma]
MKERIEVHPVGHRSRTSELLSLLPKRGPKAFGIFIEALIETKQVDLAEDLDEDLTANLLKHMVTEETTHSQETNGVAKPSPSPLKDLYLYSGLLCSIPEVFVAHPVHPVYSQNSSQAMDDKCLDPYQRGLVYSPCFSSV